MALESTAQIDSNHDGVPRGTRVAVEVVMSNEIITDYASHLAGMIARGESIADIDTSNLSRDRIRILRRMQAGLSAGTVAEARRQPDSPVAKPQAKRRVSRAKSSRRTSLYCSCANCRSGRESLCLRDS